MNKFLLVGLLIIAFTSNLYSATFTWSGGGDGESWSDPDNWNNTPLVPGSLDDVIMQSTSGFESVVNINFEIHSLTIIAPTNTASPMTRVIINPGVTLKINGNLTLQSTNNTTNNVENLRVSYLTVSDNSTIEVLQNVIFNVSVATRPERAVIDMGVSSKLNCAGNIILSNTGVGTLRSAQDATVEFNGTTNQNIPLSSLLNYKNIIINNPTGVLLLNPITSTNLTGNIIVQNGSFSDGGFPIDGDIARNFTVNSGAIARFSNSSGVPSGFENNFDAGSTVYLEGGTQTLATSTFDTLVIAGTGDKTLSGNVIVNSSLKLEANNIITLNNYILVQNPSQSAVTATGTSKVVGNLQRAVTTGENYSFPVGLENGPMQRLDLNFSQLGDHNFVTVSFSDGSPGQSFVPKPEGAATYQEMIEGGFWSIHGDGIDIDTGSLTAPIYELAIYPVGFSNGNNEAFTVAKRTDAGSQWYVIGSPSHPNPDPENDGRWPDGSIRRTGVKGFSDAGVMGSPTPTPVDLKSFHAKLVQDHVELDWVTLSETKSSHFVIERSRDSHSFDSIGTVLSAGNSSERLEYDFADLTATDILAKILYYRLKQVDVDGQSKTYPMVGVDVEDIIRNSKIKIFPNPATVDLTVASYLKEDVHLDIYNPLGKVVDQKEISSEKTTIDTSKLEPGVYVFKFINGSTVINKKVIIK